MGVLHRAIPIIFDRLDLDLPATHLDGVGGIDADKTRERLQE